MSIKHWFLFILPVKALLHDLANLNGIFHIIQYLINIINSVIFLII